MAGSPSGVRERCGSSRASASAIAAVRGPISWRERSTRWSSTWAWTRRRPLQRQQAWPWRPRSHRGRAPGSGTGSDRRRSRRGCCDRGRGIHRRGRDRRDRDVELGGLLDVRGRLAEFAQALADGRADFGQLARAQDEQGDHQDDDQFGGPDVRHIRWCSSGGMTLQSACPRTDRDGLIRDSG